MIILGVDWGRVRTGVAVSDELGLLAHPAALIEGRFGEALALELAGLARAHRAETIVLGLPLNMDGSEGESAAQARRLAERLREASGVPVELWDERLTTWEAERLMAETGRKSPEQKKRIKDQLAACLILQSYLDSRKKSK